MPSRAQTSEHGMAGRSMMSGPAVRNSGMNGMQIGEQTVAVSTFQKRDERNMTNLYIKNFPQELPATLM